MGQENFCSATFLLSTTSYAEIYQTESVPDLIMFRVALEMQVDPFFATVVFLAWLTTQTFIIAIIRLVVVIRLTSTLLIIMTGFLSRLELLKMEPTAQAHYWSTASFWYPARLGGNFCRRLSQSLLENLHVTSPFNMNRQVAQSSNKILVKTETFLSFFLSIQLIRLRSRVNVKSFYFQYWPESTKGSMEYLSDLTLLFCLCAGES